MEYKKKKVCKASIQISSCFLKFHMTWSLGVAKSLKTCLSLKDTNKCLKEKENNNECNHSYTAVILFINKDNA